jgi:hypothetical protein
MEPCFSLRFLPSKMRLRNHIVYVINWRIQGEGLLSDEERKSERANAFGRS